MTQASGIVICFTRCNAPPRFSQWGEWLREVHLPDMSTLEDVRAASHWALTQQPTPGMPSVGFSHVTLYELTGDVGRGADALFGREDELRGQGRIDPNHCILSVDVLEAHGRWNEKPLPSDALTGHIMAYVMCNDPRREQQWDHWNDQVHVPDMLDSGAFSGVSRWRRTPRGKRGAQHLTLYDVGPDGVDRAVERSAAVMPGLAAAGRKHEGHVGGLTVTLARA
ncbi:MAG: hypothetical protein JRJ58_21770 [Deltaproteobacteria bacterium]|nr:hypothetical protein [Deltaproteobacteria bacterium]